MRMLKLRVVNFKGVKDITLDPLPQHVVKISGPNGAGKSSIIDGEAALLCGKAVICGDPIRNGESHAELEGTLGEIGCPELRVKVTLNRIEKADGPDGYTYNCYVYDKDGGKYAAPRDVLKEIVGKLGYDVSDFLDAKSADQLQTLQELVPLTYPDGTPFDPAAWERKDAAIREQRRDIGRDVTKLQGQLAGLTHHEQPAEPVDVADLMRQINEANQQHAQHEREQAEVETMRGQLHEMNEKKAQIAEQIKALQTEINELGLRKVNQVQAIQEAEQRLAAFTPADTSEIEAKLEQVQEINSRASREAAENDQHQRATAELAQLTEKRQAFDSAVEQHAQAKQEAISRAKYPAGISLGADSHGKPCVLYNEIPLEQASQAEQLKAAAAIGMFANPKLRVLMVREASLFDTQSMAVLEQLAADNDYQVFAEIVDESGNVGVMIQDGMIAVQPALKPEMALFTGNGEPQ